LCPSIHSMSIPAPVERCTFTDLGAGLAGADIKLVSHTEHSAVATRLEPCYRSRRMSSNAPGPAQEPYYLGPPPVAERVQKPPYRPSVSGKIGFFFGPPAAALVLYVNLRRMGHPEKARRILIRTIIAAILIGFVMLRSPDAVGRLIGLAVEIVTAVIFPPLQEAEFAAWQQANPAISPSNGWLAIGLGVLGLLGYLMLFIVLAMVLP